MVKLRSCLIIFIFAFLLKFTGYLNADEYILAIVNEEVITSKDLRDFSNFMRLQLSDNRSDADIERELEKLKHELLQRLIEDRLILQEAKRQKIEIDKNIVQKRLDEIRKRYPTDIDFQEALNVQGLTPADIEKRIQEQLLIYNAIEKNIKSKIVVDPQEVTRYYQEHLSEFVEPEKRDIVAIVFKDRNQAEEARKILESEDIEEIIKRFSLEIKPLGTLTKGQLKKEFDEVVFNLKENKYSEVLNFEDKYYIFFLKKIIPSRTLELSEAKTGIYSILLEKKTEKALKDWLDELRKKSYIQIKED